VKLKIQQQYAVASQQPLLEANGKSSADGTMCVLFIYNFADDIDLEDKDEVSEVINDVKELLMPFKCLVHVAVMVGDVLSNSGSVERTAIVEATFDSVESGQLARNVLNGAMIGGRSIDIEIDVHDDGENLDRESNYNHGSDGNRAATCSSQSNASCDLPPATPCPPDVALYGGGTASCVSGVLLLEHIVTKDNMEDEDEVQEVLRDLREICGTYGSVASVWIEQRTTTRSDDAVDGTVGNEGNVDDYCTGVTKPSLLPWALLQYSSLELAAHAVSNLNGVVICGSRIEARLYDWVALNQSLFSEDFFIGSTVCDCATEGLTNSSSAPSTYSSHALRLKRFIRMDQIEDEEEEQELLQDLQSLLASEIPNIDISIRNCIFIRQISSTEKGDDDSDADVDLDVLVMLQSLEDSLRVMHYLNNRLISGELLSMDILLLICGLPDSTTDSPTEGSRVALFSYSAPFHLDVLRTNQHFILPLDIYHLCDCRKRAVVVVRNYFTDEDLHEDGCFEDIAQMKSDLHALAAGRAHSIDCNKPRCEGILNSCQIYRGGGGCAGAVSEDADYVAMVSFRSLIDAEEALLHLDGRLIGGVCISARLELMDQQRGGMDVEVVEVAANSLAISPCTTPSESSLKGRILSNKSCIAAEAIVYSTAPIDSGPVNNGVTTSEASISELQIGGKFKVAKTLPKQTFHASPKLAIPVSDHSFLLTCSDD